MGRFTTTDPAAEEYASISPYAYVANNPLKYIDPTGKRIVLPNASQGKALASDLNRIYENKYGVSGAFTTVTRDVQVTRANPEYGFLDMINPWSSTPETVTSTESRTFVETTENFNSIEGDKYSSQLKEVIDADTDVNVNFISDSGSEAKRRAFGADGGFVETHGGGFTDGPNNVVLSDGLSKTSTTNEQSNLTNWTIGGVFLHEVLYHIHPGGRSESSANSMRESYNQKADGREHGSGNNQNYKVGN